jgi:uncharacterized protein YbjT (DUF2867 family)
MAINWRDRPVLVTRATGLVGGRLVHRLVEAEADVVSLVRDGAPRSELMRSGLFRSRSWSLSSTWCGRSRN